jgi:hypothetical protein
MSAQLQLLVLDRQTHAVRNSIHTMMFEGVSKDDVNYRMLVYHKKDKANKLLLFYPNGIVCVYENILQQANCRKKVQLSEVLSSEYGNLIAPQIVGDRLIAVSTPVPSRAGGEATGLVLVSIDMESFESEVVQKKTVSTKEISLTSITDLLPAAEQMEGLLKVDPHQLKLTDMSCSISKAQEVVCFLSFNNGMVCHKSFGGKESRT